MVTENTDNGISITDKFDIEIDSSGDIAAVSNEDELEKDLALLIRLFANDRIIGNTLRADQIKDIESQLTDIISSYDLVETVFDVSVNKQAAATTTTVDVRISTIYGTQSITVDANN